MTDQSFSDEILMAYADNELDAETAHRLEQALETDDALAERLALFLDTREVLADVARARPVQPVPDALLDSVTTSLAQARGEPAGSVLPFQRPATTRVPRWMPTALAASLALAVGLGAGFGMNRLTGTAPQSVSLIDAPGLAAVLSEMPSGTDQTIPAGKVRLIASFRDDSGAFCREFEFDAHDGATLVSVACHGNAAWQTRLAVLTGTADTGGYAPVSSLDTLEAYLTAIGVSEAMSPEQEAAALNGLTD